MLKNLNKWIETSEIIGVSDMEFLELVHPLGAKIVDSSEFIDFYSYEKDGLGTPKVRDKIFFFPNEIVMACVQIANEYFLLYKNFVPLWRYVTINDCDPDNWRDMFPTQQFFLTPTEDIDLDLIEKIYSQIFETHQELVAVLAVETSPEGF